MPYKRKATKQLRRKVRTKRRKLAGRRPAYQPILRVPFGKSKRVAHRYCELERTLNPGAGGLNTTYVYSANGLYDPNISGAGHQPLGFDQMASMYDQYTVIGAKIHVVFQSKDTNNFQVCGISVNDDGALNTDLQNLIENGTMKYVMVPPKGAGGDGYGRTYSLTYNVNPNKFLGYPKPMSEDGLRGNNASNPDKGCFFHIHCGSTDGTDTSGIDFMVVIDYQVVWTEPKDLAQS